MMLIPPFFWHTVETSPDGCPRDGPIHLSNSQGLLANLVTQAEGCGGERKPWVITVHRGQVISITLLDFNVNNYKQNSETKCEVYARISEQLPQKARNVTVCGGSTRQKAVYTSTTNRVEVAVITNEARAAAVPYFLLKYEGKTSMKYSISNQGFFAAAPLVVNMPCQLHAVLPINAKC